MASFDHDIEDFRELAKKIEAHNRERSTSANADCQKMTIYIRNDIADAFNALITERGQQKEFANIAFADFVKKKAREMGVQ